MEAQHGDRLVQGPKKGQLKWPRCLKLEHGGKGRRKTAAQSLLVSDSIFAKPD
jgi:hypothetical protein